MDAHTGQEESHSEQLEPPVQQCIHFTGGSEFNEPLRLRRLKESNPELYQELADKLQDLVGDVLGTIPRGKFTPTKKYISTVLPIRDTGHSKRVLQQLRNGLLKYPGELFIWCDEGNHYHFVHDCPCSNGSCRCSIFKGEEFRGLFRNNLRGTRFINELDWIDWVNIILYFIHSKWPAPSEVWTRGRLRRSPTAGEIIRWKDLQRTANQSILEGKDAGIRHYDVEQQSDGEDGRQSVSSRRSYDEEEGSSSVGQPRSKRAKRSVPASRTSKPTKFERILLKTETILNEACVIPPIHTKELFFGEEAMCLHDPSNQKYYEAACQVWASRFNRWTFSDLKDFYSNKTPIFYANDIDPFTYYHDRETSFHYIDSLLQHQYGNNDDAITTFLCNIQDWFNKYGWDKNPKINALAIIGPPNSGKNYFFDIFSALACNVGHIGRVNNKTNNFALQDIVNRRLVIGNEISMEEGAKEDMKKICEGTACNIRVKFQGDKVFTKAPVLLISNFVLDICNDPTFRDVRLHTETWSTAELLKDSNKKPYPLVMFDIFEKYNVFLQ